MTDPTTEPIPTISEDEQLEVWSILYDETLTEDEREAEFSELPENMQQWAKTAIFHAFLDNTSELAAKQRRDESKDSSEMT